MALKKPKASSSEKSSTILYRSETNKVLGGVCGGLGEVFNIDPTLVRVLFVLAALFGGSGILFYLVLWIVIPSRSKVSNTSDENIRENIDEMKERVHTFSKDFGVNGANRKSGTGMFLLVLGVIFLLSNFGYMHWFNFSRLWPVFLIIFGFLMIARRD
jgi:phage shock protein PspC (stress-responsive transcriptional regulator)